MKKGKTIVMLLAATLLLSGVASAFTDVDDNAYYADAVKWAIENEVTNGVGNNEFGSLTIVTRAQAMTFLWRASGKPAPKGTGSEFADVKSDAYYHDAVLWAVENNITNGVGDNRFDPEGAVTRGQMITFLWRTKGSQGARQGDKWYEGAERWAINKGLLAGTAQTYTTDSACPRSDVVFYIWKEVNAKDTGNGQSGNQGSNEPYIGNPLDHRVGGQGVSGSTEASEGIEFH